jgi:hypothetical protein
MHKILLSACILALTSQVAHSQAGPFTSAEVCKSTIGAVMGRDPATISVINSEDEMTVGYARPSDGSIWRYRCKINGNRVIWATETGRWRDDPQDGRITFDALESATKIRITENHTDGSSTVKVYERSKLRLGGG